MNMCKIVTVSENYLQRNNKIKKSREIMWKKMRK